MFISFESLNVLIYTYKFPLYFFAKVKVKKEKECIAK